MCRYKNIIYPQLPPNMLIMIVIDTPIGSVGSKKGSHSWIPLGPLVPRCVVQWWPMYQVNMCTSVVTNVPS